MRLLFSTAVIAMVKVISASADDADNTIFKQHGSLQYVDNFFSPEESKHFYDTMESLSRVHPFDPNAKSLGNVMVNNRIQRRIKDAIGTECSIDDDIVNGDDIAIQTRFVYKSTKPHIDYEAEGKVVEDDVVFITLNSNPEAHFNHGGNSLPAVAGRLVRFAGNAVHGTTLNGGDPVRLLGPFSIKNFASVGQPRVSCPDSPNGYCFDGVDTISTPIHEGQGVCLGGANPEECYEPFEGGADCPSGTGVCISEGDFVSDGAGAPCVDSVCYECTNRAGTCPPPTSSPSSSPTSNPTSAPSNAPTLPSKSKSGKSSTTKASKSKDMLAKSVKSIKASNDESTPLLALIVGIIMLLLQETQDGAMMGAMLEALNDEGGHGRALENKEDIKALLVSVLEEKLNE